MWVYTVGLKRFRLIYDAAPIRPHISRKAIDCLAENQHTDSGIRTELALVLFVVKKPQKRLNIEDTPINP